jgi:thymidylate synthase
MEFRIENGFPFTPERSLKGAFHMFVGEVLWILSGDTSQELLNKYGVTYWDSWCQDSQCERHGLRHGQFGATYGHQFRNFGGSWLWWPFKRYRRNGFDQLSYIVDGLRKNPHWRRLLITPFNPHDYDRVEIVPCHGELFFVSANDELYLHLVQRSGDWPIGVPSNMVMWAFAGIVIAELTGLRFAGMSHFVSNAHYYGDKTVAPEQRHEGDQTAGVEIMLSREPRCFPTVQVKSPVIEAVRLMLDGVVDPLSREEINPEGMPYLEFLKENVTLEDYHPHPAVPKELLPVSI